MIKIYAIRVVGNSDKTVCAIGKKIVVGIEIEHISTILIFVKIREAVAIYVAGLPWIEGIGWRESVIDFPSIPESIVIGIVVKRIRGMLILLEICETVTVGV